MKFSPLISLIFPNSLLFFSSWMSDNEEEMASSYEKKKKRKKREILLHEMRKKKKKILKVENAERKTNKKIQRERKIKRIKIKYKKDGKKEFIAQVFSSKSKRYGFLEIGDCIEFHLRIPEIK